MRPYLFQFRELYHQLNLGGANFPAILSAWTAQNAEILASHAMFREFNAPDNFYALDDDDLHSFYALSRVCDLLIEPLEPSLQSPENRETKRNLMSRQFADFWATLDVSPREPTDYHPFWCEIAAIKAADSPDAPPRIEEIFWPALTFGNLLICRAGVRVRAGINVINPAIAATSPLYFAYRRAGRKAHDLSHGWGSNSQWRTGFRRDYVWRGSYIFNADGAPEIGGPSFLSELSWHETIEPPARRFFARKLDDESVVAAPSPNLDGGLTPMQREELLTNRCFVRHQTDEDDFWPYDDTLLLQIKSV